MSDAVIIRNEEDAYSFLSRATDGGLSYDAGLKFDGWPKLHIHLTGEKFQGTITPTIMKGLIELQKHIHQSYALIKYGEANTHRLSQTERDELEIRVKVTDGSSNYDIDFQALLTLIFTEAIKKMNPELAIELILGFSLMYFGASSLKVWMDGRKEIRLKEIESEEQRATIEALRFSSEQETKNLEIMAQAMSHQPLLTAMTESSKDFKAVMLKALSVSESISLQGVEVSGEVAEELSSNSRRVWQTARMDGVFRIHSVDSTDLTKLKVKIRNTTNGELIVATVQDSTMDSRHKTAIQEAEWQRLPLELTINAKELNGQYKEAVIISAKKLAVAPPAPTPPLPAP